MKATLTQIKLLFDKDSNYHGENQGRGLGKLLEIPESFCGGDGSQRGAEFKTQSCPLSATDKSLACAAMGKGSNIGAGTETSGESSNHLLRPLPA